MNKHAITAAAATDQMKRVNAVVELMQRAGVSRPISAVKGLDRLPAEEFDSLGVDRRRATRDLIDSDGGLGPFCHATSFSALSSAECYGSALPTDLRRYLARFVVDSQRIAMAMPHLSLLDTLLPTRRLFVDYPRTRMHVYKNTLYVGISYQDSDRVCIEKYTRRPGTSGWNLSCRMKDDCSQEQRFSGAFRLDHPKDTIAPAKCNTMPPSQKLFETVDSRHAETGPVCLRRRDGILALPRKGLFLRLPQDEQFTALSIVATSDTGRYTVLHGRHKDTASQSFVIYVVFHDQAAGYIAIHRPWTSAITGLPRTHPGQVSLYGNHLSFIDFKTQTLVEYWLDV
jgi:hypothetical protein